MTQEESYKLKRGDEVFHNLEKYYVCGLTSSGNKIIITKHFAASIEKRKCVYPYNLENPTKPLPLMGLEEAENQAKNLMVNLSNLTDVGWPNQPLALNLIKEALINNALSLQATDEEILKQFPVGDKHSMNKDIANFNARIGAKWHRDNQIKELK